MLPLPNLDDQTYDEPLEKAKNLAMKYYPAWMKLMGVSRRSKKPAETLVHIEGEELSLLFRHKLKAGSLCFETERPKYLIAQELAGMRSMRDDLSLDSVLAGQMDAMKTLHFLPFGMHPKTGTTCLFRFQQPLPPGKSLDLY
ncbi:MAG: hypothetical protein IJ679_09045, partial [Lachnospiraceae bacterium]|nr:hypothetical protein [Lachnospiraceae bacterium]